MKYVLKLLPSIANANGKKTKQEIDQFGNTIPNSQNYNRSFIEVTSNM